MTETDTGGRGYSTLSFYYQIVYGLWDWLYYYLPINDNIMLTCGWVPGTELVWPMQHLA